MEKQGNLDLRLQEVDSREWIDLEMQVLYSPDYIRRSKFYLAGMYRDQLKKNKDKNYDDLKPCYGVHLLLDNFFRDGVPGTDQRVIPDHGLGLCRSLPGY